MSMQSVISASHVGKRYTLRHLQQPRYQSIRDVIRDSTQNALRRLTWRSSSIRSRNEESFWALQDVSFEINAGERVGIIGRNGAGKSTLLKVLSRIVDPTTGRIQIRGRVSSLLEVGTGFHPELTGRENVFLNGAILGMTRKEIARKFDEIVDFAEVERFLDTPVKHYSSGMYVRLAFAVAAHLEPEILIVDEVLAVGDAQFQKKCLGKMESVGEEGRTVIFVSHSMPTVTSLCRRAILLDRGRIVEDGAVSNVISKYYGEGNSSSYELKPGDPPNGDQYVVLLAATVKSTAGVPLVEVQITESVIVEMVFEVKHAAGKKFVPDFHFFCADGTPAFSTSDFNCVVDREGIFVSKCRIPGNFLNDSTYFVGVAMASFDSGVQIHFYANSLICFNVFDPIDGVPTRGEWVGRIEGAVRPELEWMTYPHV